MFKYWQKNQNQVKSICCQLGWEILENGNCFASSSSKYPLSYAPEIMQKLMFFAYFYLFTVLFVYFDFLQLHEKICPMTLMIETLKCSFKNVIKRNCSIDDEFDSQQELSSESKVDEMCLFTETFRNAADCRCCSETQEPLTCPSGQTTIEILQLKQ